MVSITEVPLGELCREADPATVTDFVAGLYEARGRTTDRHSDRQFLVSDGDRTRRVAVAHPADGVPASDLAAWADTVVTFGASDVAGAVDVIGPATLREQLAYAVDRSVARRLLAEHFDWRPVPDESDGSTAASGVDSDGDHATLNAADGSGGDGLAAWPARVPGALAGRPRVLLAAVLVLVAAGGMTIGLSDVIQDRPLTPGTDEDAVPEASTVTPSPTPTTRESETATESSNIEEPLTPSATVRRDHAERFERLPPGVDQSGAIEPRTLSNAHESQLTNTSYRLSLTYREFVADQPTGVYTETIKVANATHYSASVTTRGKLVTSPFTIAESDVYADGSTRYERTENGTVERGVLLSYDRFVDDYALYLLWFLEVRNATIVDVRNDGRGATAYIVTDENPDPSVTNTSGSIVVTEAGLVEHARWSYDFSGTPSGQEDVSAILELRVTDVGTTTVRKPDWVNATAD